MTPTLSDRPLAVKTRAVRADRHAPRPAAHALLDDLRDLPGGRVDHIDRACSAPGHIQSPAIRGQRKFHGPRIKAQADGARHLVRGRVDDGHGSPDLGRDIGPRAVLGKDHVARAVADQQMRHDLQRPRVDHRHRVAGFGRDIDPLTVGADRHAFGFHPRREKPQLFAGFGVDADGLGGRLQRGPDLGAVRTDRHPFRVAARAIAALDGIGRHVDSDDGVFGRFGQGQEIADRDIDRPPVGADRHAARAHVAGTARDLDRAGRKPGLGVDDADVGIVFVGDVNPIGLGLRGSRGQDRGGKTGQDGVARHGRFLVQVRAGSMSPSWSSRSTGSVPGM